MTVTGTTGGHGPGLGFPPRPGQPVRPGQPGQPQPGTPQPGTPAWPGHPAQPSWPEPGRPPQPSPIPPSRVWLTPAEPPGGLYERLMARRIVMASGQLDGEAATRLSAQLLTLDAEGDEPIRLELQSVSADLPAALAVMGVLDVVGVPVHGRASGQISGAALGVLAACSDRSAYPNAVFAMSEPRAGFDGTATELTAQEEQLRLMIDTLYRRLGEVTGQEVDAIRADARRGRLLSTQEAISYGLVQGGATAR
ncbi:MAG: ATP-dependent Clp protease proteolytic subunit [Actinomycetota bacterium]